MPRRPGRSHPVVDQGCEVERDVVRSSLPAVRVRLTHRQRSALNRTRVPACRNGIAPGPESDGRACCAPGRNRSKAARPAVSEGASAKHAPTKRGNTSSQVSALGVQAEDWPAIFAAVTQPAIFFSGPMPIAGPGSPAVISAEAARQAAAVLPDCRSFHEVPGNHWTMVYGEGARQIVDAVTV